MVKLLTTALHKRHKRDLTIILYNIDIAIHYR